MKENNLLNVNLQIRELSDVLQMQIPAEFEEVFRKAASEINEGIANYRKHLVQTDFERILAMVAVRIAAKKIALEMHKDDSQLYATLQTIDAELQAYLDAAISK